MNKIIITILFLLVSGSAFFLYKQTSIPVIVNVASTQMNHGVVDKKMSVENQTNVTGIKEFTVIATNYAFDPMIITVNQGDRVKIIFKNSDGFHDWKIDEFNIATKKIKGGEEDFIEFTADKAGTFEYYCSVGKHRAMGMKGTLIIQ